MEHSITSAERAGQTRIILRFRVTIDHATDEVSVAAERTNGEWSTVALQQAGIARIGRFALENVSLDAVFDEALFVMADTLDAPLVSLLRWNEADHDFEVRAASQEAESVPREFFEGIRVPGGTESLPGYVILREELVRSDDLCEDERFRAKAGEFGSPTGAAIMAPVGWAGQLWGVLGAWTAEPRRWSDDDARFVQTMATTLGLIMFRRAAEIARLESSTRLELALDAARFGVFDWSARSDRIMLDDVATAIAGLPGERAGITPEALFAMMTPADRDRLRHAIAEALQTTGRVHMTFRFQQDRSGGTRWVEFLARVIDDPIPSGESNRTPDETDVRIVGVVGDITEKMEAEERLEAALEAEARARRAAERARERAMLLAEASERFAATLDPIAAIESLTEVAVPAFADGAFVLLRGNVDGPRLVAARLHEESKRAIFDDLMSRRRQHGWSSWFLDMPAVWDSGRSARIEEIDDADRLRIAVDEDHARQLRTFGICSVLTVPMRARGESIGAAVFFQTATSDRRFDDDDQLFAEQLADRAAVSWSNGQIHESRNRVVASLQDALLPPALPMIPGIDLVARYEVADLALDVGGDFYDVIEMGEHRHGFVVGDVTGRGPDAAATTGLVRHSIRTAAVRNPDPAEVLRQTNSAVLDQIGWSEFCTVALVRVDIDEAGAVGIRAVSAGHPCPIVLRSDGRAEVIACQGTLLGVVERIELVEVTVPLEPGDTLVLYTDGFTEARRGDEFFGEEGMLDALRGLDGLGAAEIADGLIAAVDEFAAGQRDDQALLVARVSPEVGRG